MEDVQGLESVKHWSVSESASQEFDRKKFFEMIDYVTEKGIKNIVFDKIDRACRGLRAAVMIEDLIESGVCFHFVRDNLVVNKNSAPSEKLRFYLGVVLAKWYIDNLKSEIKKGLNGRLENGYFNAKAPMGYRNIRPEFGKANLEIHPEIGPFMNECFELYKTGNYSRKDLERLGIERGIKWLVKKRVYSKSGEMKIVASEKIVTHKTLEKALSNPVYCQYKRTSKGFEPVKNAKWPALTSFETFMACQKIKGIRAQSNRLNLAGKIAKPLMQLMKCGECDHQVTGQVKKKASGKIYIYYHCANRNCEQCTVYTEQQKLIAQLSEAFKPLSRFTPKATAAFIKLLRSHVESLSDHSVKKLDQLKKRQEQLHRRLEEVENLQRKGLLRSEEVTSIQAIKRREIQKIEEMASGINHFQERQRGEKAQKVVQQNQLHLALDIIELLKISYDFMQLKGFEMSKARVYKAMLSNPTLKDGKIEFCYEKPFDDLLLLTGGRNWWRRWELNPRPRIFHIKALHA